MPRKPGPVHYLAGAARWPFGVGATAFSYIWRATPIHRRELEGAWDDDRPPELPASADQEEVQRVEDGRGDYLRRRYRIHVRETERDAAGVMAEVQANPNVVVPRTLAHFAKTEGAEDAMAQGDEFTVRMPGPWDGPVRVIERTPTSFRFITLAGHIEAGQIEWRARDEDDGRVAFEIESWSRPGDLMSELMHHKLRMAKEVQLHMWISVLEQVARRYGHRDGPLDIETRRMEVPRDVR